MPQQPITVITGGSRGIGAAVCVRLAADGHDIGLGYRSDATAAQAVAASVRDAGRRCVVARVDTTDEAAVEGLFAGILSEPPNLAQISVDNCEISGFATGVLAYAGTISVSRSHIAYNTTGVYWQAAATLTTYGNNTFAGNATDGTFNQTLTVH